MRSNRDTELEGIINEMYTHKIEIPVNNTVEDVEETDSEVTEAEDDAADSDKIKCPHCDKIIQASSCASHREATDEDEDTEDEEDPVDESGCNSNRKKKKPINAAHCN